MRKTLLIISLGMSMAYADSEERSWTEKAMDMGREIKYSVEAFFDDISDNVIDHFDYISDNVIDHYDGLTKGSHYWFVQGMEVGTTEGYEKGLKQCPNEGL